MGALHVVQRAHFDLGGTRDCLCRKCGRGWSIQLGGRAENANRANGTPQQRSGWHRRLPGILVGS